MFKPANHDSRLPSVLQAHTKENLIAQLAVTVVFIGGWILVEEVKERRAAKRRAQATK